jgi:hypothetical protein
VKRSTLVVIAIAVAALAAAAYLLLVPQRSLPLDPLAAVPADAYGVLRIKVDRVLGSEAYKRLVVERGEARGIERVTQLCGFNPLEKIRELVVFARPSPGGGMPRFAFTARGELDHDALVDCVKKFGDGGESQLVRDDIEGIPGVRSAKGNSRAHFVGRDGIVGGDSESVVAAINTMVGKAPSLSGDGMLRGLYGQFDVGTDIAGVARMPQEARVLLQAMAQSVLGSQIGILTDAKAVAGSASLADARIAGGGLIVAASPEHAVATVLLVRNYIDRLLNIPGIGLTPAAGVLRGIQTDSEGDRATISGQIKVSTAQALLELLPAINELRGVLGDGAKAPEPAGAAQPSSGTPTSGALPSTPGAPTVEPLAPTPGESAAAKKRAKP